MLGFGFFKKKNNNKNQKQTSKNTQLWKVFITATLQ